jgi:UDP-N-acetylmuramoylalanine--D-glutamate ligase
LPIIGEIELGCAAWSGRLLAVTGSKGKSSLVKLCADTLNAAGVSAAACGNYGAPLSRVALQQPRVSWAVVEVSSFQMEHARDFRPDVAVLLNLQADHLDRHADMAEYRALKLRLFARQAAGDTALLPEGLRVGRAAPAAATLWRFGAGPRCAWRYADHRVSGRDAAGAKVTIPLAGSWFDNPVLGLAAAAGAGALTACGLDAAAIARGLSAFVPLPHRVQFVLEYRGARYVDDSKATSFAATAAALQMIPGPVRLIAGGRIKEHALAWLKELLTRRARKVYCIGECAPQLVAAWSDALPCENCGTLENAVAAAAREAGDGETVLLSPGCASFDQFTGYRERGERFTRLVQALAASPNE